MNLKSFIDVCEVNTAFKVYVHNTIGDDLGCFSPDAIPERYLSSKLCNADFSNAPKRLSVIIDYTMSLGEMYNAELFAYSIDDVPTIDACNKLIKESPESVIYELLKMMKQYREENEALSVEAHGFGSR